MHYLGFDCHKQQHAWALLDENGRVVQEGSAPNTPSDLCALRVALPDDLRVAFEGSRSLRGALESAFAEHPCFEICPAWTHEQRKRGRPKPKNDRHDAQRVARALYEESDELVPLPPPEEQRSTLTVALQLHRRTTKDRNITVRRLHDLLSRLWQGRYRTLFRNLLGTTARRFFARYPHPYHAARARDLGPRLRTWSRAKIGDDHAKNIRHSARDAGPPTPAEQLLMREIQELLERLHHLIAKRARLTEVLCERVCGVGCAWLLEQPGLGPLRAAELIDAGLLESPGPNSFARLAGIAPVEDASGQRVRHRNAYIRHQHLFTTLMDWAQWLSMPQCPVLEARTYFVRKRAEGKTRGNALRCLAKQALHLLFRTRNAHRSCSLSGAPRSGAKAA